MSEAPERIWVKESYDSWGRYGHWHSDNKGGGEKYVRAEHIEELEAQLEAALEVIERIGKGEFAGMMLTSFPPQDAAAHYARVRLGAIKRMRGEAE